MRPQSLITLKRADFPTPASQLDSAKVSALAEVSISGQRYTSPPVLGRLPCGTLVIIAGNHRIAGLLEAGAEEAEFYVRRIDSREEAEYLASEDNLVRRDLPVLVRAESIAKCADYLRTVPVSHQVGAKGRPKGGDADIARRLGFPPATFRRLQAIGRLSAEAKAAAWDLKLEANQSALAAAAQKQDPAEQVALLVKQARKCVSSDVAEQAGPELEASCGAENSTEASGPNKATVDDHATSLNSSAWAAAHNAPDPDGDLHSSPALTPGRNDGLGADVATSSLHSDEASAERRPFEPAASTEPVAQEGAAPQPDPRDDPPCWRSLAEAYLRLPQIDRSKLWRQVAVRELEQAAKKAAKHASEERPKGSSDRQPASDQTSCDGAHNVIARSRNDF